ncbi:hypothetical protein M9Y10_038115 [Tritrichomonas musculus]|uniref:Uncharacterized protein n=1 Tax=Tritrichomonas musculus TaxID=1915356 RepID=A0ABR2K7N8_9EUKA
MFFLLLYQYVFCFFKYVKPNEIIDNKSVKEEDTFEISPFSNQAKHKSDIFLLNVSKTSYFRPLKIDLNQIPYNNIHFRSLHGTQYVLLSGLNTLTKKSITFESIFIFIESTKLNVYNLSLIESPISCTKGLISICTNFLTSDFLSIPAKYISTINISEQFNVLNEDSTQSDHFGILNEPHAKIILQENVKYSEIMTSIPKVMKHKSILSDNDIVFNPKKIQEIGYDFPEEYEDNLTASYFLNSSLEQINIYNSYVIAVFSNSTINLTANTSHEIEINTSSTNITMNLIESPSYRNHLILNLYLIEKCTLTFGSSFDLITNSFVLEDINIHHFNGLTARSLTSVPYVAFIPIESVVFIPERHNSENYCLCLKSRFESCVSNSECLLYHVNKLNYFVGSNSSFLSQIARSKARIINIYVTYTGLNTNDYHIVALKQSSAPGKVYNFISTSEHIQTILSVHDTALDNSTPISLSFTDITRVILQVKTGTITSLTLKNSLLNIENSFSVPSMTTDLYSLSGQQIKSITVSTILTFSGQSQLYVIGIDIILSKNALLEIKEISYFPQITFSSEAISFSDGDSELTVGVEDNGPVTVAIEDSLNDMHTVIDIHSDNSNIQLEMIVQFVLTNPLIVSYQNAFPLPQKVQFAFLPSENEMSTLSLIMPHDDDDGPGHRYNFSNITGNLNLILLTPNTVFTFIMATAREDFFVNNIPTLSLNLMDYVDSVTIYEDSVNISSKFNISMVLQKNLVYQRLTLLTNATHPLRLSLGKDNMKAVFPITIESTMRNTKIFFDDSFRQLSKKPINEIDDVTKKMLETIIIKHYTFNITLMTSLEAVPMVIVDDDIVGVLYVGNQTEFLIPENKYYSFRSGPELIVNITDDPYNDNSSLIEINQSDFLAEKVTFCGNPFIFNARSKSLTNYTLIDAPISIDLSKSNNKTWFNAFALDLNRSPITHLDNFLVDYLKSDIYSLSKNSIKNLVVTTSSSISDDSLNKISISKDRISLFSKDSTESPASIKSDFLRIYYGGSGIVNVTISEKELNQQIFLFLTRNTSKIVLFEKSWYKVSNANRFVIICEDKSSHVIIQADLMNMPDIVVVDSNWQPFEYKQKLYQAVYTNGLSFVIFITLVLVVVVISIVLMIVGFCKIKKKSANYDIKPANTMLSIPEMNNSNDNELTS